jgi:imidazolonepropionase-like amidohydrolase
MTIQSYPGQFKKNALCKANRRNLMRKLNPKNLIAALAVAVSVALPAAAQDASGPILLTNVNVFDGVNEDLIENANVVVTDNLITAVSTEPLAVAGGTVIDGGGRTLMPGMIDVHWHTVLSNISVAEFMNSDMGDHTCPRTVEFE